MPSFPSYDADDYNIIRVQVQLLSTDGYIFVRRNISRDTAVLRGIFFSTGQLQVSRQLHMLLNNGDRTTPDSRTGSF